MGYLICVNIRGLSICMRKGGDFIFVKNLFAKSVVGLDAWQRSIAQPLRINLGINVGARFKRLALTDELRRTLNYDSLSTSVLHQIESQAFKTAEDLASHVSRVIQSHLTTGESSIVTVSQPKARLLTKARETSVSSDSSKVIESIKGLNIPTIIGVNDLERVHPQIVEVDIEIERSLGNEVFTHQFVEDVADQIKSSSYLTIETFANKLAEYVCTQPAVQRVAVRAGKPSALNWADAAQIHVERSTSHSLAISKRSVADSQTVYIAFGSNQGDSVDYIRSSIDKLHEAGVSVEQTSALYTSEPMYYSDQPRFYNGVFRCVTRLGPLDLLKALKKIEYGDYSRVKQFENGPRTMDLDILLYGDEIVDLPELKIPHIDMLNRSFVLKPLNDVTPGSTQQDPAYPEALKLSSAENMVVPLYHQNSPQTAKIWEIKSDTAVMAIMNATDDSFSDGGDLLQAPSGFSAVALEHLQNGAMILDIGGQSTRPGAKWVDLEEEISNVCRVITEIRSNPETQHAIISIDTCWAAVAEAALNSGANIINDVFGGSVDPKILEVAARTGAPIILSHSRGDPRSMDELTQYPEGVVACVASELRRRVDTALAAGCKTWQLILDPGLGFAKTNDQNLELVRKFHELKSCDALTSGLPQLPWLVGASRKRFIGELVQESDAKNRLYGTLACLTVLSQQGAEMVRVHDTKAAYQALRVADAVYK